MNKKIFLLLALAILFSGCTILPVSNTNQPVNTNANTSTAVPLVAEPISNALARVTKKPFGIYITPNNSPVSPEKFTGYHTGADFEILPGEENIDVNIFALCTGQILEKKYATGYGGVLVQACNINNEDVTIIYGHLRLASIAVNAGDTLTKSQQFAVLGTGYSTETDGERKHLHLGIHKGTAINILGYVQTQNQLNDWIDPMTLIK